MSDATDAADRIREIRREIEAGENALDAEPINSHLAADVVLYGPDVEFVGIDDVAQHYRDLYDSAEAIDVSFTIETIDVVGPVAVERGTYDYAATSAEGAPSEGEGTYLYVYEYDGDDWRIHRIVWG